MAAPEVKVEVTVSMAWWWQPYVWMPVRVAAISGREPDWEKFQRKLHQALRVKFGPPA